MTTSIAYDMNCTYYVRAQAQLPSIFTHATRIFSHVSNYISVNAANDRACFYHHSAPMVFLTFHEIHLDLFFTRGARLAWSFI